MAIVRDKNCNFLPSEKQNKKESPYDIMLQGDFI